MQTDRNLLFGVLAFQDEYIDLAQLAAICRAWATDKSRSIPQLLVDRQWLNEPDRDELERKVERKLKRFVGDAHATLGAVADSAVRDALRQVDDPDVRAAIPELTDESRLGFHPDPIRSSPDRSGWNPNLQNDVDPASQSDKSEPRYTRGQLQGEGSFGIVWLAYDKQLDREVALKELKTSKSRNPDLWKRFLREAQVTGKLQHPNIVPVYELDPRASGEQPFYTMKPVKGRTLRKAIDAFHQEHKGRPSETLELNRLLQSFVQVCEALAYAHSRDVVHRDLKPENIVLGDFGEVIVLDWGEAKLLGTPEPPPDETTETVQESDAPLVSSPPALRISGDAAETPGTKLGTAKGSPGYMSPEQVRGDVHLMEPRTDVYGLGAILFDILIGHPPHQPTPEMKAKQQRLTIEDWRSIILANPTPRAREHNATIPVTLDAICAKAMAAALSSRYSSANELAQDVQRFLADEPVSVCQDPVVTRARRWMKRHQVTVATTAAAVLMAVIGLGALLAVNSQHQTELERKNEALTDANQKKDEQTKLAIKRGDDLNATIKQKTKELARANLSLAQTRWQERRVVEARRHLESIPQEYRGWEVRFLNRSFSGGYMTLVGHELPVADVSFSPDGARIASTAWNQTVKLWDATTGNELHTLEGDIAVFAPDGQRLGSHVKGMIKLWDVTTGREITEFKAHSERVASICFNPDGKLIATGSPDAEIKLWDVQTGTELRTLRGHAESVNSVCFSPNGQRLASASSDKTVKIWNVSDGKEIQTLSGHTSSVQRVAYSSDGELIASSRGSSVLVQGVGETKLWSAKNGQEIRTIQNSLTRHFGSFCFSPDGQFLALGTGREVEPGVVVLLDLQSGSEILALTGHSASVTSIGFSPDGQRLVTGSFDTTIKLWSLIGPREGFLGPRTEFLVPTGHTTGSYRTVYCVCFSPDGQQVASASGDQTIKLWDVQTGRERMTLSGHTDAVKRVCFSPDGKWIASASDDKAIKLWNARSGDLVSTFSKHGDTSADLIFSVDSRYLQIVGDSKISCWDIGGGEEVHMPTVAPFDDKEVSSLTFSPSGQRIAACLVSGDINLFDAQSSKEVVSIRRRSPYLGTDVVAFSPDGQRLVSWCSGLSPYLTETNPIELWDAHTGKHLRALTGHTLQVTCATFSPNGNRLATGSFDRTIKLWDLQTGEELLTIGGNREQVASVCFNQDGDLLAFGLVDGAIKVIDARAREESISFLGHTASVRDVNFSPNGQTIASGGSDQLIKLWDVRTGREIRTLNGHTNDVICVKHSPDGKWIASGSNDQTVKLWNASSGEAIHTLKGHSAPVTAVRFSSDGKKILTSAIRLVERHFANENFIWDVVTGQSTPVESESELLRETTQWPIQPSGRVSPDHKWFAVISENGFQLVSRSASDRELAFRRRHATIDPEWQATIADFALTNQKWYAVAFHRTWLVKANPDAPSPLIQLLVAAREVIAAGLSLPPITVQLLQERGAALPTTAPK